MQQVSVLHSTIFTKTNFSLFIVTVEKLPNNYKLNYLEGMPLLRNQFFAMFLKKTFAFIRTWNLFLFQFFLPIILLIISVLNSKSYAQDMSFPSLNMALSTYTEPIAVLSGVNSSYYYDVYKSLISGNTLEETDNVNDYLLQKSKEYPSLVKSKYIVGASITDDNDITAWFNGDPYHGSPLALTLVIQTIFKTLVSPDITINIINHPLPLSVAAEVS